MKPQDCLDVVTSTAQYFFTKDSCPPWHGLYTHCRCGGLKVSTNWPFLAPLALTRQPVWRGVQSAAGWIGAPSTTALRTAGGLQRTPEKSPDSEQEY